MKKARNTFLLALALLSVVSMGSVAGTYAKYTSTNSSADTARVAKWGVTVGTQTIDLFKTTYGAGNEINASEKVVAPGASGSYTFSKNATAVVTDAGSEVEYDTEITVAIDDQIGTIVYKLDGGTAMTASELETALNAITDEDDHEITWEWAYEKTDGTDEENAAVDTADTTLGNEATAKTVTFTITTTATQKALS